MSIKETIAERAILGEVVKIDDNATLSDDKRNCDEQEKAKDYVHDVTRLLALFQPLFPTSCKRPLMSSLSGRFIIW